MISLYPLAALGILYYLSVGRLLGKRYKGKVEHRTPQLLANMLLRLNGVHVSVSGLDNLNEVSGAHVVFSTHSSMFDAFILHAKYPVKIKSFWSNRTTIPSVGFRFAQYFGKIFDLYFEHDVLNQRKNVQEFRKAKQYLDRNGVVSFFPSGKIALDEVNRNFGTSCVGLARRNKVPIVPVLVKKFIDQGKTNYSMQVLPPLNTNDLQKKEVESFTRQIEDLMNRELKPDSKH